MNERFIFSPIGRLMLITSIKNNKNKNKTSKCKKTQTNKTTTTYSRHIISQELGDQKKLLHKLVKCQTTHLLSVLVQEVDSNSGPEHRSVNIKGFINTGRGTEL